MPAETVHASPVARVFHRRAALIVLAGLLSGVVASDTVDAETHVIPAPPGDVAFGTSVTVLPNGNFVVVSEGPIDNIGAVHLYRMDGTRISTLTGSSPDDRIGSGGIVVLSDGNFVVVSDFWRTGDPLRRGAVAWVSGTTELEGTVSAQNSLIGVGGAAPVAVPCVSALPQGRYLVAAPERVNNVGDPVGAVIRANASGVTVGTPSSSNSLIWTQRAGWRSSVSGQGRRSGGSACQWPCRHRRPGCQPAVRYLATAPRKRRSAARRCRPRARISPGTD